MLKHYYNPAPGYSLKMKQNQQNDLQSQIVYEDPWLRDMI